MFHARMAVPSGLTETNILVSGLTFTNFTCSAEQSSHVACNCLVRRFHTISLPLLLGETAFTPSGVTASTGENRLVWKVWTILPVLGSLRRSAPPSKSDTRSFQSGVRQCSAWPPHPKVPLAISSIRNLPNG